MSQSHHPPPKGAQQGCQTDDLLMIHALFRHVFEQAPGLVAGADAKNPARVQRVAAHLKEAITALEGHHHHEDHFYWHLMKERCAPEERPIIDRMEQEHQGIAQSAQRILQSLRAWEQNPMEKDTLVAQLQAFYGELKHHLADEEEHAKPIASRVLAQHEWDLAREAGLKEMPKGRLNFQMGYLLHCAPTEALRQAFWNEIPPPVRLLYKTLGKRKFEKEFEELYGRAP